MKGEPSGQRTISGPGVHAYPATFLKCRRRVLVISLRSSSLLRASNAAKTYTARNVLIYRRVYRKCATEESCFGSIAPLLT
jgi:hypothetical protein